MLRRKLSGKVAVVFGTFAPMHIGHVDMIQTAARECDGALVLVSGRDTMEDRGAQVGLPLTKRTRYAREVFADDELIAVEKLDEEGIPVYPAGWDEWTNRLMSLVGEYTTNVDQLVFYVGEPEYVEELKNRVPNAQVKLVDRSTIPISATAIRNNPYAHWKYLTHPFKRHFTRKVLVVGSASGGKSTLVKHLARYFGADYSPEYAREYQQIYNVRDEETGYTDFLNLLQGQYNQTQRIIDHCANGLVIADTNSTVTQVYIDHYLKDNINSTQYDTLTKLYESIAAQEQWDLILLVEPTTDYVDDGFRDMTMSDEQTRNQFTNHLKKLLEKEGRLNKTIYLTGRDGENPFVANYQEAKAHIERLIGESR